MAFPRFRRVAAILPAATLAALCLGASTTSAQLVRLAGGPRIPRSTLHDDGRVPDSLLVRGVSLGLARLREAQVSNVRYDLRLDVTGRDTAQGEVRVSFERRGGGDVVLDFRGPQLGTVRANGRAVAGARWENGHVVIPAASLRNGENTVEMSFAALIAAAGASIIRFRDERDAADYLYTLLVPSDANALFPCFDQPSIRGRLTLSLTVPRAWTALANGITEGADSSRAGVTTFRFRRTEPLPTYLYAFAAGPWRRFQGGPRNIAFYVRASRAHEVEVDSLQNQVATALTSMERWFGVPYPFQQFQYLLAPAFPFGGMEHPGVTMFNEEQFIYREPPTLNQRLGRRATIYHEVAHMWFGDYVTMRWFDDLWLKEGFSTYVSAKMMEREGLPNPWLGFYQRNKPSAYDVDVTRGTTPVWQELANLDQAKSNYGPIVYNKAPSVLRQLDYLVGDAAFQRGVQQFLRRHAYGAATWRDLLASIGAASRRPMDEWGRQYMLRAGMPVLEQRVEVANGVVRRLMLVQRPATADGQRGTWPMRTEVLLWNGAAPGTSTPGVARRLPVEIRAETTYVREAEGLPAPDLVYANHGDYAYALVMLDSASTRWALANAGRLADPLLRAMVWGSLWDLVRDARLDPRSYVTAALAALPNERDEQIAAALIGRTSRAIGGYIPAALAAPFRAEAERALLAGAADTTRGYGVRKSHLDAYVSLARSDEAIARLSRWLDGDTTTAGLALRQPTRWAVVTALVARDVPNAEERLAAEARRDTTTAGRRQAFVAAAARPTPENKRAYFTRYFGDSTLNEEWATASLRAFNDPARDTLTLPFLETALDSLPWIQQHRRIFFLGSWLGAFLGGQRSPEALAVVDRWLAARGDLALDLRRKVLQARDDLERAVRIQARFAGPPGRAEMSP